MRCSSRPSSAAPDADPLLVYITELRTRNLMWGLLDIDAALGGQRRRPQSARRSRRRTVELTLNEALLLAYGGRPRDALDSARRGRRARASRGFVRCARSPQVPALIGVGPTRHSDRAGAPRIRRAVAAPRPSRDSRRGRAHPDADLRTGRERAVPRGDGARHRRLRRGDLDVGAGRQDRVARTSTRSQCAPHGKAADRASLAVRSPGTQRAARDGERTAARAVVARHRVRVAR